MDYFDTQRNRLQHSHLQIYDLNTGMCSVIREFEYVVEAPLFTKDMKALIYNSQGKIFQYNLESGAAQQIETGIADTCNNDHVLSPDGRYLGVSSGRNGDLNSRIYMVNLTNGAVKQVTPTPHSYLHGWSPDGKVLVYCGARKHGVSTEWDVYSCPITGEKETRLTCGQGFNDGPEFSPDGKAIWYNSTRSGQMQLWKMNPDGTNQRQMTFDESRNSWFSHVSPDGRFVIYISYRKGDLAAAEHLPDKEVELRMIPSDGGEERVLLYFIGGQGSLNVNSWSPDSTKFAFVSYS